MNVLIEQASVKVELIADAENTQQVVNSDDVSKLETIDHKTIVLDIRKVDPITGEIGANISINAVDALVDDALKLKGCNLEEVGYADTLDDVQSKINSLVKVFK